MAIPVRNKNTLAVFMFGWLFCWIEQGPAQVAVQIGQNFTGSSYGGESQAVPADGNGTIGPQHFMEFVNGAVAVYKKTNGVRVQLKTDLKFWSDAGLIISTDSGLADPRVIYDPSVQRWFASQVDFSTVGSDDPCSFDPTFRQNDFLLAVSVTNDPTKGWHAFLFQSDPDNGYFADFPTLGLDSNAVYISGDFYQGELNPLGAGLVSIPKADLIAHTPTVDNRTWFGVMDYAERGQVLQPAVCVDGSSQGSVLAVGDIGMDDAPHSNVVSFAVDNAGGPGATLTASTQISVTPYSVPFNEDQGVPFFTATQPDGTMNLAGNDARLSAKVYAVGGVLYAVHSTEEGGRMAIRWYRIRASDHALLESGTIADPGLDLFFPSIGANGYGTVVIGYNGSSINAFITCYAVAGATVNGVTTFGSPMVLQAGTIAYHGDDELLAEICGNPLISRWGDYSTTSVDPSDPSRFWTIQMYASDTDIWSTQITELITFNPVLTITRSDTQAVVSWLRSTMPLQLESKTNFAATSSWTHLTTNLSTNNGRIFYQTPLTASATFFRLHIP